MSMNFNIVKKPKKNDDDVMDEDEIELEEEEKTHDTLLKKRLLTFLLIIVGVTVLLLLILYIFSLFSRRSSYTYEEIEQVMKSAAVSYFQDHPEYYPQDDGDVVEIDVGNLIAAEKMKDLSEYTSETCSGTVQVTKGSMDYLYTPYLNCGENYVTVELYNKVMSDNSLVSSGYGLYSNNGGYAFRGEKVNNYVQLDNALWRIVKITSNNYIELVLDQKSYIRYTRSWDNRFNPEKNYDSGINQYSASRVKEYLDQIYDNPVESRYENILSDKDKGRIVPFNLCIGRRNIESEVNDNSLECSEVLSNQKLGLLTLSDYLYASVDPNCKSAKTKSCKNYNYLKVKMNWWLATASDSDSYNVFSVNTNGVVNFSFASNYAYVRPVIYLNNRVLYQTGNGSAENPYTVR